MSSEYHTSLTHPRWRKLKWRRIVLAQFSCEKCGKTFKGKRPKTAMRLFHLHHVHYRTVGAETLEDVRILCPECHFHPSTHPWRVRRTSRGQSTGQSTGRPHVDG